MRISIISGILLIFCYSCGLLDACDDKDLNLKKTVYNGKELRLDGYYYGMPIYDHKNNKLYQLFVFYRNGILIKPGTIDESDMNSYIKSVFEYDHKNTKYIWGLFNIDNQKISIEHWVAAQCGYPALLRTGEILNDTTFVLNKMIRRDSKGTTESEISHTFHFRKFDIKPDSTNNFIK